METNSKWFGMDGTFLMGPIARILNIPQEGGILVQKVAALSPVDMMGIKGGVYKIKVEDKELLVGGDILLNINDIPLDSPANLGKLRQELNTMQTGDSLTIRLLRGGEVLEVKGEVP